MLTAEQSHERGTTLGSGEFDRRFLTGGGYLFVALSAANLSNYVFHIVMTRLLGPSEYGALGALLAVVLVLGVPISAIQAVVARRAAQADEAEAASLLRGWIRLSLIAGTISAGTIALAAPFVASFFHIGSATPLLLLGAMTIPAMVAPVARGVLQGRLRFGLLGGSLLGAAALKLSLGAGLVAMGAGVNGALASVLVAEVAGALIALSPVRRMLTRLGPARAQLGSVRETGRVMAALLAYWALVTIDLPIMRHYASGEVSGRYASATLIGRAVLFLPAGIVAVVYPRMAARPHDRRLVVTTLGVVGCLCLVASIGIVALPGLAGRLFGQAYVGSGAVGSLLAFAMSGYAAVHVLLYHRIASGRPPVKTLWVALVIETTALVAWSGESEPTALSVLWVGAAVAIVLAAVSLRKIPIDIKAGELWEAEPDIDLTVVTPAYNSADRIAESMRGITEALRGSGLSHEVILVSDGSVDGTQQAASESGTADLRVLHYEHNRGKGYALRLGMARARGEFVAFIDSDGDLDPHELGRFVTLMRLYHADLVIGSKRHPLSDVEYPATRRVMSWTYHKLVRVLFGIKATDTQTGIKVVRREVLARVLPRLLEKRFAFDLELLVAARRQGYARILEAPVRLRYQFSSTIARHDIAGILLDTAAIWYRRYLVGHYDPILEPEPSTAETSAVPAVATPS